MRMAKGIIILIIVILVTALGLYIGHKRQQRLTSIVDAVVSRVELRQLAPKDNGRFETDVFYSFTVDGKTYETRSIKQGKRDSAYSVGMPGKVKFNPNNPSESDVISE